MRRAEQMRVPGPSWAKSGNSHKFYVNEPLSSFSNVVAESSGIRWCYSMDEEFFFEEQGRSARRCRGVGWFWGFRVFVCRIWRVWWGGAPSAALARSGRTAAQTDWRSPFDT
eukprot:SAG11_NODE_1539_length_4722_cov_4.377028_7_plen_112_part_00